MQNGVETLKKHNECEHEHSIPYQLNFAMTAAETAEKNLKSK